MIKNKEQYCSPNVELLELRVEAGILTGSIRPDSVNSGYEESNDLGEI